jgi:hypothetical protein
LVTRGNIVNEKCLGPVCFLQVAYGEARGRLPPLHSAFWYFRRTAARDRGLVASPGLLLSGRLPNQVRRLPSERAIHWFLEVTGFKVRSPSFGLDVWIPGFSMGNDGKLFEGQFSDGPLDATPYLSAKLQILGFVFPLESVHCYLYLNDAVQRNSSHRKLLRHRTLRRGIIRLFQPSQPRRGSLQYPPFGIILAKCLTKDKGPTRSDRYLLIPSSSYYKE